MKSKKLSLLLLLPTCLLYSCDDGYDPLKSKSYFEYTKSDFLGKAVWLEEGVTSICYTGAGDDYRLKAIKENNEQVDLVIKGEKGDLNASSLRICSYCEFEDYVAFSLYPFEYVNSNSASSLQYGLIDMIKPISVLDDETRMISNYTFLLYKPKMIISICPCSNSKNLFYNVKSNKYEYPIPLMDHYSGFYLIHDYCLTAKSGDGLTTFEQVGDGCITDNDGTVYSFKFSGNIYEHFDEIENVKMLSSRADVRKIEDDGSFGYLYSYSFRYYYHEWEGEKYIAFEKNKVVLKS